MVGKEFDPTLTANEIVGFTKLSFEGGSVGSYILVGPLDEPVVYHTFIGLYPVFARKFERVLKTVSQRQGENALSIYNRILSLEIPERVRNYQISSDRLLAQGLETFMHNLGLPSIALSFGEVQSSKEEAVVLAAVVGMMPEEALNTLKMRIRQSMKKFN